MTYEEIYNLRNSCISEEELEEIRCRFLFCGYFVGSYGYVKTQYGTYVCCYGAALFECPLP